MGKKKAIGLISFALSFYLFQFANNALAAEGALEINQVCAEQGGCFPGDAAGFPVTVTNEGSYVLTSKLDVPAGLNGITVSSSFVTLDLNGFSISGTATCTGSGPTLSCSAGTGRGIRLEDDTRDITVRNGIIRNMPTYGILAGGQNHRMIDLVTTNNSVTGIGGDAWATVARCTSTENGIHGIDVDAGSLVESSVASGNGDRGIEIDGPGGTVTNSIARGNGMEGFWLAAPSHYGIGNSSSNNGSTNECGGGICTTQKRFYLTENTFDGSGALTACDSGFHMASLYELIDTSGIQYDSERTTARTNADSGFAMVSGTAGFVRTGQPAVTGDQDGLANCNAWTSNIDSHYGTRVSGPANWSNLESSNLFFAGTNNCDVPTRVWCIEDPK